MNLIKITPRGYCKGVVRAINIAINTKKENPNKNVYILGMIVHNKFVTDALNHHNIITLSSKTKTKTELLDEIDKGIVIFTAHGISDKVKQYAINKGLEYVDATCLDVLDTRSKVIKHLNNGEKVLYIGKRNHPEAESIVSISDDITLICDVNEVKEIKDSEEKYYVTNQTTTSILEIKNIFEEIEKHFKYVEIENEICQATFIRQEAVIKNSHNLDLLYVVGDIKSNNSNMLKEIALKNGVAEVYLIGSALELKLEQFKNKINIGVTSGASTPTYLTNH